jgi:uncharacterized protein YbdZ (MbtH family)
MNPQNEDQDIAQNSAYNPFPEPQTIPAGWDMSGLTASETDSAVDEEQTAEN